LTARAPTWAAFFSPSAYKHFMRCVEAELRARGLEYELVDGGVALRDRQMVIGLSNLAQACHASVPPKWPELVRFLLDRVAALSEDEAIVRERLQGGEAARVHLRVRLHADDYLASVNRAELIVQPVAPGLAACLAWDLPASVTLVRRSEIDAWNLGDDALSRQGLDNVRSHEPVARAVVAMAGGTPIAELSGGSHYAATHALWLHEHEGCAASDRLVVAVPNRHQVLFARLGAGEPSAPVIAAMQPLVARAFRNGPGSICPDVFWWKPRQAGAPSMWVRSD